MLSKRLFTNIGTRLYSNLFNHKNDLRNRYMLKSDICYYSIDINDKVNNRLFGASVDKTHDNCVYCMGKGLVLCRTCNGSGKMYYDGFKEVICDTCSRFGCVICNICDGSGIYNNIL